MDDFEHYELSPRGFQPVFPKAPLLELIAQLEQDSFPVDVDLKHQMLIIALPYKPKAE